MSNLMVFFMSSIFCHHYSRNNYSLDFTT